MGLGQTSRLAKLELQHFRIAGSRGVYRDPAVRFRFERELYVQHLILYNVY